MTQKLNLARSGALGQVVSPCQVSEGGKPASRYSLSLAELVDSCDHSSESLGARKGERTLSWRAPVGAGQE